MAVAEASTATSINSGLAVSWLTDPHPGRSLRVWITRSAVAIVLTRLGCRKEAALQPEEAEEGEHSAGALQSFF